MLTSRTPFHANNRKALQEKILAGKVTYPKYFSTTVTSLLKGLLNSDPAKRFTFKDIQKHSFFSSVKWDKVLKKTVPSPFVPKIDSPTDVSNFDDRFTCEPPIDTPPGSPSAEPRDSSPDASEMELNDDTFAGFSYAGDSPYIPSASPAHLPNFPPHVAASISSGSFTSLGPQQHTSSTPSLVPKTHGPSAATKPSSRAAPSVTTTTDYTQAKVASVNGDVMTGKNNNNSNSNSNTTGKHLGLGNASAEYELCLAKGGECGSPTLPQRMNRHSTGGRKRVNSAKVMSMGGKRTPSDVDDSAFNGDVDDETPRSSTTTNLNGMNSTSNSNTDNMNTTNSIPCSQTNQSTNDASNQTGLLTGISLAVHGLPSQHANPNAPVSATSPIFAIIRDDIPLSFPPSSSSSSSSTASSSLGSPDHNSNSHNTNDNSKHPDQSTLPHEDDNHDVFVAPLDGSLGGLPETSPRTPSTTSTHPSNINPSVRLSQSGTPSTHSSNQQHGINYYNRGGLDQTNPSFARHSLMATPVFSAISGYTPSLSSRVEGSVQGIVPLTPRTNGTVLASNSNSTTTPITTLPHALPHASSVPQLSAGPVLSPRFTSTLHFQAVETHPLSSPSSSTSIPTTPQRTTTAPTGTSTSRPSWSSLLKNKTPTTSPPQPSSRALTSSTTTHPHAVPTQHTQQHTQTMTQTMTNSIPSTAAKPSSRALSMSPTHSQQLSLSTPTTTLTTTTTVVTPEGSTNASTKPKTQWKPNAQAKSFVPNPNATAFVPRTSASTSNPLPTSQGKKTSL